MKGTRILILCSFLSLGMGSCSPSLQETCRSRIPQLQKEILEARREVGQEIARWDGGDALQNRAIASVGEESPLPRRSFELDQMQKRKWQDWSAIQLKSVESYLDFARTQTELEGARKPLSDIAENLVDFNGYADRGELYQMREALHKVQDETDAVLRLACTDVPQ